MLEQMLRHTVRWTPTTHGRMLGFQVGAMACVIVLATAAILVVRARASDAQAARLATAQLSSAVYAEHSLEGTALADRRFPATAASQRVFLDKQIHTAISDLRRLGHISGAGGVAAVAIRFDAAVERTLEAIGRGDMAQAANVDAAQIDPVASSFTRRLDADSAALARSAHSQAQIADLVSIAIALLTAGLLAWFARRILLVERRAAHDAALARAARETEAELRQAQKMDAVGRLAAGVAHDFNNLLTGIVGYASLIATRAASDHPNNKAAHEIIRCAHRAAELTRQLLAFGRKQDLHESQISTRELLDGMRGLIAGVTRGNVTVSYDIRDDPLVFADANQLEQVVLNLVVNAQHAMPAAGAIAVSLQHVQFDCGRSIRGELLAAGSYALITVADTGHGMDAETLSKIFEPYFSTKGDLGTGLGLPTSLGIVAQSGGQIDVTSTLGVGTRFEIFLPAIGVRALEDGSSAAIVAERIPLVAVSSH
jgi:signal transduction histidine kinase